MYFPDGRALTDVRAHETALQEQVQQLKQQLEVRRGGVKVWGGGG